MTRRGLPDNRPRMSLRGSSAALLLSMLLATLSAAAEWTPHAGRIEKNVAAPYVGVRILGQQFERVRAVPAPDYAERVAKAMAAKYWSDLIVHHFSHPLTLRLVAEPGGDELHHERPLAPGASSWHHVKSRG